MDRNSRARVGIFDHTSLHLGGGQLVVAHMAQVLSQHYNVELIHTGLGYTLKSLESAFGLDLAVVQERLITGFTEGFGIPGPSPILRQIWHTRILTQPYDLFVYSGHGVPPFCYARHGLVYCLFPMESRPDDAVKARTRWKQRGAIDRWFRSRAYRLIWRICMAGYTTILADSEFTARWILRRWGKISEVVYPPVELVVPTNNKQNLIVSIGRFTANRRSKNQHEQVRVFREFLRGVPGEWHLCLMGTCGESPEDRAYLASVERASCGLPVTLLVNADREAICRSLGQAKLFWHTAGLSTDEEKSPEDAEHFGLATVEAMRAGCVPIVIGSGGQREIIRHGVSGFLCKDLDELRQKSIALAHDDRLFSVISEQAELRSRAFTRDVFDQRIMSSVSKCLDLR